MHTLLKMVYSSVIGSICLWLINVILGLYIPINLLTALAAGVFGIPGVLVLVIYYLLN